MAATHAAGNYFIGAAKDTYGEIQSYTENNTAQIDEAMDANGDVFAYATRDERVEITMEIVTTAVLPLAGTKIACTSASAAGYVILSSVNLTESNTDHRKATITGIAWLSNALPAS